MIFQDETKKRWLVFKILFWSMLTVFMLPLILIFWLAWTDLPNHPVTAKNNQEYNLVAPKEELKAEFSNPYRLFLKNSLR